MNLSRRGLWLAVLILLLGIIAQWMPGDEGHLWRPLAGLWLIAVACEGVWTLLLPLQAHWTLPRPLRLGITSTVSIGIATQSRRPLTLDAFLLPPDGVQAQPRPHRLTAGNPGHEAAFEERWTPLRLGDIVHQPLRMRVLGLLGLAWWSRTLPSDSRNDRVEPDLGGHSTAIAGRRVGSLTPMRMRGSGSELLELRDYHAGDSLRTLAWKASARRGRLLVREFEQEQQLDVMMIIDGGRAGCQQIGALTRLHHAVNTAARLARRATELGDRVGLLVYDGSGARKLLAPVGGSAGLLRLQRELGRLVAHLHDADPLPAAVALRNSCPRRTLALWFTDVDTGSDPAPLSQCARLLVPRHLPLFAGLVDRGVKELAYREPREWKDPYIAAAALQSLEAATHQAVTLRRLGCQVVQALPEEIDARLLERYEALRARHAV